MRVLAFLLCCFFSTAAFAVEFSFDHTESVKLVFVSSGFSLHEKYCDNEIKWEAEYFPMRNHFYNSRNETVHIPGMTVFTSDDVQVPGEKKNILDYKGENLIRRAEIIFFGALTFASFAGWLGISGYNMMMGASTFGTLKRYQFMTLFIGSGVVGFAVSLSDVLLRIKPYMKNISLEY
ncbi:MAG: hypothetical protein J1G30_06425 [Spirochaetales bacterium]|nr:hypothetical protein [Spirochaetales bacterium]